MQDNSFEDYSKFLTVVCSYPVRADVWANVLKARSVPFPPLQGLPNVTAENMHMSGPRIFI